MKFSILFVLALLLFTACKKEQPQPDASLNCDCAKEVSADFKMGEIYNGELVDLDTMHYYLDYEWNIGNVVSSHLSQECRVNFSANLQNALSYEWQVGNSGTVQTSKDFYINFHDTIGTIPVRLIVHAKPNLICFPYDDGIDTVVRYLTITSMKKPYLIGKFLGANTDNPSEQFTIEIDTFRTSGNIPFIKYGIKNLPLGNGFDAFNYKNVISFKGVNESGDGLIQFLNTSTQGPEGFFDCKTGKIKITYSAKYYNSNNELINQINNKTFIGTKL